MKKKALKRGTNKLLRFVIRFNKCISLRPCSFLQQHDNIKFLLC